MWFIGVEVEQETSAPPPKKKSWIRPWRAISFPFKTNLHEIVQHSFSIVLFQHHKESAPDDAPPYKKENKKKKKHRGSKN